MLPKKKNDIGYQFEIFYVWPVIVGNNCNLPTTLLAWHYFWWEEIRLDTFWTDLISKQIGLLSAASKIFLNLPYRKMTLLSL